MDMFINRPCGSDRYSYRVTDIKGDRAVATPVILVDNEVRVNGDSFPIECRKGIWGVWHPVYLQVLPKACLRDPEGFLAEHPAFEEEGDDYVLYDRTPTGKPKHTFDKLGRLVDFCDYYYDPSF